MKKSFTFFSLLVQLFVFLLFNSSVFAQYFSQTTSTTKINYTIRHYGDISIGSNITTPLNKLHVDGAIRITGTPPSGYGGPTLIFGQNNSISPEWGQFNIEYLPNEGLNFSIPWPNPGFGNFDLFLSHTNKVGMGTNNFNCTDCNEYRLFVKNGIKTEKIKVEIAANNGWADYVFDDNYNLMSINSLKEYLILHNHLPEVPTEKEAIENGIELKEMNILLLKKVEELTLYLIELNEKLQKQNEEIEKLKNEIIK